jgi:peptidoglycan/LPS O-acetylase OafA/YrhL
MVLRFGRLYPLHIAVLLAFLWMGSASVETVEDSKAFLAHAFLLHGIGFVAVPIWGNVPSWSISTEFFVYMICAAGFVRGRMTWPLVAAVLVLPPVIYIGSGNMAESDGYQLARGLYGFAAGAIAWRILAAARASLRPGTLAEIAAVVALIGFVSIAADNALSVAGPVLFPSTWSITWWQERWPTSWARSSRPAFRWTPIWACISGQATSPSSRMWCWSSACRR